MVREVARAVAVATLEVVSATVPDASGNAMARLAVWVPERVVVNPPPVILKVLEV
jgi:hypothetical protein